MADLTGAAWRKSQRSGNGGNCVEVADNLLAREGRVFVRDSKEPDAGTLAFTRAEWTAFIGGVRDGEFDL
ncbi:DUF397 domain-containing protein [Pilimelia columellifera]|uniref:DUF397 domain-containing protein n=1 Tax=Pilimelia columellifera subsp. columellifera TaxID=706583 RepID=A0ABP6ARJ7_9ACTN